MKVSHQKKIVWKKWAADSGKAQTVQLAKCFSWFFKSDSRKITAQTASSDTAFKETARVSWTPIKPKKHFIQSRKRCGGWREESGVPFRHNINTTQCSVYRPWGLFSMLCFLRFNEVSREWLSLCPLSCNSSALIAWFCLEGNLYSLVFCLPFGGTNCSVLNKIFQFIRLALVKGLSELRATKN